MKIIFLDVYGVLNCEESIIYYHEKCDIKGSDRVFPDVFLARLKKLVDLTGAKIVVSSSWRYFAPANIGENSVLSDHWNVLIEQFKSYGLDKEIIGITPILHMERGEEIKKWLKGKDVEKFVILDDDSDMCELTETNLAKCSWKTGFTREVFFKALEILR